MKIICANVCHGFVYADDGQTPEAMQFTKFSISDYINYFKKHAPDILCLTEVLQEDSNGNSSMLEEFSRELKLPFYKTVTFDKSWIYIGKMYGIGFLSKYPIKNYESFMLPNPKFEVIRPNGDLWIMHDKCAQYAELEVDEKNLNLFNLHYFPLHHFHKSMQDEDLKYIREELVRIFKSKDSSEPTIIAGDFNNKGIKLKEAYPELFEENIFEQTIDAETTLVNAKEHIDHIIYTKRNLRLSKATVEKFLSDHYAVIAEVEII